MKSKGNKKMSGKTGNKRSTRRSAEAEKELTNTDTKLSQPDPEPTVADPTEVCTNGKQDLELNQDIGQEDIPTEIETVAREEEIVTQSCSETLQEKKPEEIVEETVEEKKVESDEIKETDSVQNGFKEETNSTEMEPLVLEPDEPEPELQFDEASDLESGKDSPVITSRCRTRRSQLRNIPTPKTPKTETPQDETKTSFQSAITDHESSSSEDLSTKAQPGTDETRLNFTYTNSEILSPFLVVAKEKTFGETVRLITARPSVRAIKGQKANYSPYPERESVVEALSGLKRKNRSETPEETKRFKRGPSGIFSYISSPIFGMKDRFGGDVASSTPKLTAYKNRDEDKEEVVNGAVGEKKWCSIM